LAQGGRLRRRLAWALNPMEYPTPPTDSLYKFLALAGLVMIMFSISYPVSKTIELQLQEIDVQAERKLILFDLSELSREVKEKNIQDLCSNPENPEIRSFKERLAVIERKRIDVEALMDKLKVQRRWVVYYVSAALCGSTLGLVLSCIGFIFWYKRVQVPNDTAAAMVVASSLQK
jgi:hypothetical protein